MKVTRKQHTDQSISTHHFYVTPAQEQCNWAWNRMKSLPHRHVLQQS